MTQGSELHREGDRGMRRVLLVLVWTLTPGGLSAQVAEPTVRELQSIMYERERANGQRFEAQEKAVAAALAAAKEAVTKAEIASEKRLDSVNEFRGTLRDQQLTLVPRAEVLVLFKGVDDRIKSIEERHRLSEDRITQLVSRGEGVSWTIGIAGALIGLAMGLTGTYVAVRRRPAA